MLSLPFFKFFVENKTFESTIRAKARAQNIIQLYYLDGSPCYHKYAERMLNCSPELTLIIDDDITSQTFGRTTLCDARWCCVRHCPFCQFARSRKYQGKFLKSFNEENCGGDEYLFITLTLKNCPVNELRDTISLMGKGWKRWYERKSFPAQGYLRSLEVTMQRDRLLIDGRGKRSSGPPSRLDNGLLMAHPHFHIVLCMKPGYYEFNFKDKDSWIDDWQSVMRLDYRPSISIKKINTGDNLIISLLETLKYTTKPADFDETNPVAGEWLYALTEQLNGVRSLSVGGNISKFCKQSDINSIEDNCKTDEEYEQTGHKFKLSWNDNKNRYDVVSGHIIHEVYSGIQLNSEFHKMVRLHGPQENILPDLIWETYE